MAMSKNISSTISIAGMFIALLGVLFLTACAAALPREYSASSEQARRCEKMLLEKLAAPQPPVAFAAELRIQVSGKAELFGEGTLLALAPDKLRVDVFSPLGTMLLVATADKQTISIALPTESAFYRGRTSRSLLAKALYLPLMPTEIVAILRGDMQSLCSDWEVDGCAAEAEVKNGKEGKTSKSGKTTAAVRNGKEGREFFLSRGKELRWLRLDNRNRLTNLAEFAEKGQPAVLLVALHYTGGRLTRLESRYDGNLMEMEIVSLKAQPAPPAELFILTPSAEMRLQELFF